MLISWILVIGGMASGGSLGAYIDIPSLLITIGGTIGVVIISFPGDKLKAAGGVIKSAFIWGPTCAPGSSPCAMP